MDLLAPSLGPPLSSFPFQNSCLGLFFDSEGQNAVGGKVKGLWGFDSTSRLGGQQSLLPGV